MTCSCGTPITSNNQFNLDKGLRSQLTTILIDEFGVHNLEAVDKVLALLHKHTIEARIAENTKALSEIAKPETLGLLKPYFDSRIAELKEEAEK